MTGKHDHLITKKDRVIAQVALATVEEPSSPCPDVAELALFIDGRLESLQRQEELWDHLASCATCYGQWRVISAGQHRAPRKHKLARIITLAGGLLAVAASIMLFVNMDYSPVPETVFMEQDQAIPRLFKELDIDEDSADDYDSGAQSGTASALSEQGEPVVVAEQKVERLQKSSTSRPPSAVRSPAPLAAAPAESVDRVDSAGSVIALDMGEAGGEILLDINRVIATVVQKIKQLKPGDIIEVKTYKRDRGFSVEKLPGDQVLIREFGYKDQELTLPVTKLKKALKTIVKTEFPRSNKAWLKVSQ